MKLNRENIETPKDLVNWNEKVVTNEFNENLDYLYPNGHRMTHQMRWFKGSSDRGLRPDIAA